MMPLPQVGPVTTAIGGLGAAAFGLVDAFKAFCGGINRIGFKGIRAAVAKLTPDPVSALPQTHILAALEANWINGTDLGAQKSIAKSLVKLSLNAGNAAALASATGVDSDLLAAVAKSIADGTPLSSTQSDVWARFDLIVTALLDEAYQRGDQVYRNGTKALAMAVSVALALAGGFTLTGGKMGSGDIAESLLVGLLAAPLAPIAKDLSTALATAVNALQLVKK